MCTCILVHVCSTLYHISLLCLLDVMCGKYDGCLSGRHKFCQMLPDPGHNMDVHVHVHESMFIAY